jgi:pyruvate/2-oxoglutarate dehydrogenase complex dihydrolipoamide dehydrogenase (E3) component
MATYDYDIGIIGGGAAGLTVAAGAAQLGVKTLLVERESSLGGDCLHFGCVPSKTLIATARRYHQMKNAAALGLPQPDIPPVDFRQVRGRIREVVGAIQRHDSPERFCGLGAKVVFGRARFRDPHQVALDAETVTARIWVVATGSSAAVPDLPGLAQVGFLTNRDLFSLGKLPESLVVLGGGPIAIEMAQAFRRLGSDVAVVQRGTQILSREDRDMAEVVRQSLAAEGVKFFLGATVREVRAGERRKEVVVDSLGRSVTLKADHILVAMGRKPNVEGLNLDAAGVEFDKAGVIVDGRMRTSRSHIFAAGDVTGKFQFTHAAGYEAGVVLANAVFKLPKKADYALMPWCTYTDPELASVGLNEKRAEEAGIKVTTHEEYFSANDRAVACGMDQGKIKLLLGKGDKPLGVQIAGSGAGDLLAEWVAALSGKLPLSTLAQAVHPYPTLAEISKRAASGPLSKKLFSDRVKKGLHFLFQYKGRACGQEPGAGD